MSDSNDKITINPEGKNVYEKLGGEEVFRQLVDIFYDRLAEDEVLREMFPEDLEPGKEHQFLFLVQYWGGPKHYQEERGHPRLRMRHMPFAIDEEARDRWFNHMVAAIDEVGIPEPIRSQMIAYFDRGASFMINRL